MTLPKGITFAGLLLAISMVFFDPATVPIIAQLVGEHAANKLAAVGALVAAFGRALSDPTPKAPTTPDVE